MTVLEAPARPPAAGRAGAPAIRVRGLVKAFDDVRALDGVDLEAAPGTVLALLGPSGAGKTTTVRVLTGRLAPDAGEVTVAGLDAVAEAPGLRERTGRDAAVDERLTGAESLALAGRLSGLPRPAAHRRAHELLERFGLGDAADRLVRTYSGGMRRRLDLAARLLSGAPVVVLDEPAAGLDAGGRPALWEAVEALAAGGTTVLLATHDIDAADRLADRIAVIDRGRTIAEGTPDEIRASAGGERLDVHLTAPEAAGYAASVLAPMATEAPVTDGAHVSIAVAGRSGTVVQAVRRLVRAGIGVEDIALRRSTLDEVLSGLAGHAPRGEERERRRP